MASTDALPIARKNVAYRAIFPILDADGDLVTGAAGLDSEVSKDQGAFADCTNEATEIATSSGMYYLDLTSTEMDADCVAVIVKTSTSGAKTTPLVFYPLEDGDWRTNVVQFGGTAGTFSGGRPEVNTSHAAGTAWNSGAIGAATLASDTLTAAKIAADAITAAKIADGAIDAATFAANAITSTVLAADAITAAKLAADVTTELQSGLATAANLATVDTVVDAIKAVTDLLPDAGALTSLATQASVNTIDDFLDTEIAAILAAVDTEVAAILAAVDTEVAAIKAKTDQLTFTVANQVDANMQSINDTTVNGDGAGTPWGP